ncbi:MULTISPECIES: hypothetical protein [Rhizobium]|uniref:Uncharacterized protein n=1 Tax=Rhizobium indicum TaxID=2583231 RepID=A0ABX6PRK7_9HYPH|nr:MULTISPECIES: hypothetical protein [Rhizobium]NEI66243.1 hypothetical protein [Rhizobium leguminosarum]NKL24143.1 hypothetical protein [Rhizobium leguminosarum bv. viciae]NKL38879.1 hypothetical protein [Rhizobium leguminosarum bv. viciae]NKL57764.1 hypothetical protein [Rhizobium leguminosarum bv. viciae]QIJ45479.1 hypothetical protein G7039_35790 [Rhizobium leguminosarum]
MSNDWYYVHQLAVLAGFRLIVLANRLGCKDEFLLELHDKLIEGLACAIARVQSIMALERQLAIDSDEEGLAAFQLHGEKECLARFRITLLDDLEIDVDTHEYRVNGGEWHYALSADCDGIEISYPSLSALTDDELGTLAPTVRAIRSEAGIGISIGCVIYG